MAPRPSTVYRPWTCVCGQSNRGPWPCTRCFTPPPPEVVASPTLPSPHRRHPAVIGLAIVVAVLLLAALAGAVVVSREPGGAAAGVTVEVGPDAPPPPLPGDRGKLAAALPGLMRFVAQARGLPFTKPVKVTLQSDSAFVRTFQKEQLRDTASRRDELAKTEKVFEALGLIGRDVNLQKAVDSLYSAGVAGYYDPQKKALFVRGDKLTPMVRITLVHELTHALQDQHFRIDRPDLDKRDDESSTGLTGLVEGDATRIEDEYRQGLTEAEQKQDETEESSAAAGIDPTTPRVLIYLLAFPYIVGPDFTKAVVAQAGQGRLDTAFEEPPTTSEQLMHPDAFLAGDGPKDVRAPVVPNGRKKIDEGVLGELGLLLMLEPTVGQAAAQTAAAGWGGDRYVAYATGNRTCVRATITMDTANDTGELRSALERLASSRRGVTVQGDSPLTLTSCG
ncbi:MAG TPA: DUF6782 family putative metallopeptidase [Acidimicrobiales bacterium]|nr:DUF6782 family putative metallopeptidase [Acidimicrobiales bacterium]